MNRGGDGEGVYVFVYHLANGARRAKGIEENGQISHMGSKRMVCGSFLLSGEIEWRSLWLYA
jgi:hypothetical protein